MSDADAPTPRPDTGRATRRRWHLAAAALTAVSLAVLVVGSPLVERVAATDGLLLRLGATYGFLVGTSGFVVAGALGFPKHDSMALLDSDRSLGSNQKSPGSCELAMPRGVR